MTTRLQNTRCRIDSSQTRMTHSFPCRIRDKCLGRDLCDTRRMRICIFVMWAWLHVPRHRKPSSPSREQSRTCSSSTQCKNPQPSSSVHMASTGYRARLGVVQGAKLGGDFLKIRYGLVAYLLEGIQHTAEFRPRSLPLPRVHRTVNVV